MPRKVTRYKNTGARICSNIHIRALILVPGTERGNMHLNSREKKPMTIREYREQAPAREAAHIRECEALGIKMRQQMIALGLVKAERGVWRLK